MRLCSCLWFTIFQHASLPSHRSYYHQINLKPDTQPSFGPIYGLSEIELKALKTYIDENLLTSFIRTSSSPAAAPILFVKKKDGTLRLCVDYRGQSNITIKDSYPLPLISETLDRLKGAKIFTHLDLREAYHLIRIKEGDEWKTAFRTRYGLYEYSVMPFGLTNAPATFQRFINDTLREDLDEFCVAYLADILIYSNNILDHQQHVSRILKKLKANNIFVKAEKCEFNVTTTQFLGFIISPEGISMDEVKVQAVKSWEEPEKVRDVQYFLGFANFYRRFIKEYSNVAGPLFNLLKKNGVFDWSYECQLAFDELKSRFTSASILKHFTPGLETIVETYASDYVVAGVLSQYHNHPDGKRLLHPVAFYSRHMTPAKCNYEIHDKERLAIDAILRMRRQ